MSSIKREMSGDLEDGMVAIGKCFISWFIKHLFILCVMLHDLFVQSLSFICHQSTGLLCREAKQVDERLGNK